MSMGNNPNNPFGGPQQQGHQDFVDRFRQGPQAVSDEEAAARYRQVAPQLPPDVYQQSAQDVFAQLTPEQRMQLGRQLVQSARQQGQSFPDVNGDGIDNRLQDPSFLAQINDPGAPAAAGPARPTARRGSSRARDWRKGARRWRGFI